MKSGSPRRDGSTFFLGSIGRRLPLIVGVCATTAILAFALVYFPYWSAAGLLKAAADEDQRQVQSFVRENLVAHSVTTQTSQAVSSQARRAAEEGSVRANHEQASADSATLAGSLASVPALTDLIRTHLIPDGSRLRTAWNLAIANHAHLSENWFRVDAPGGYVFSWKRQGASWQLVDVMIPQHVIEAAAISGDHPIIERKVQVFAHPNSSDRAAEVSETPVATTPAPQD